MSFSLSSTRTASLLSRSTTSPTSLLLVSTALEEQPPQSTTNSNDSNNNNNNNNNNNSFERGEDGIYRIHNRADHQAFLAAHKDKLVVLKVFAPWCRACKGLEPKFAQLVGSETYAELPVTFAQLSIQHNKEFVKSLGVLALPTVQFYVGGALTDNFPCGPSKVPILKRKLAALVKDHVQAETRAVKPESIAFYQDQLTGENKDAVAPTVVNATESMSTMTQQQQKQQQQQEAVATSTITSASSTASSSAVNQDTAQPLTPTVPERQAIVATIPYFQEMSLADTDAVLDKARLLTFEPKSIIMREGKPGRTFYIIRSGEVEICQANPFYPYDPLVVPASYLGTVIHRLTAGDYFGERSLLTGEPRAASIRVASDMAVTCWAVDVDDFPHSSPLSGRTRGTAVLDKVNDKYGVYDDFVDATVADYSLRNAQTASQIRGSVNRPNVIRGVDTDDDVDDEYDDDDDEYDEDDKDNKEQVAEQLQEFLATSTTTTTSTGASVDGVKVAASEKDAIFGVLRRFQQIRQVSQCFDYIVNTQAQWGTAGIRQRRAFLVQRLSPSQQTDVRETFGLIDASGDGYISLLELQRVMKSIGDDKTDAELLQVMENASLDGRPEMNLQDFEGLMAEAEFYYLFRDVFSTLDTNNSGFVKAGELNRVLGGVHDLISDDHKSLIDVEDEDMSIDYERFSRMLLGTALI